MHNTEKKIKDAIEELIEDVVEIIEEIIDIEMYAKNGKVPPKGKHYRIKVDKDYYEVYKDSLTGREILLVAGKQDPERFRLDQKFKGGRTQKVELNEVVDLTTPGIEKFLTLPLDQTEG